MTDIQNVLRTIFNVLKQPSGLASIIFDVLIITFLVYKLLSYTKGTRANEVLKGVGLLFLLSILGRLFGLNTISWVLDGILASGTIFVILFILFTPELRRMLERLGSGTKRLGQKFLSENIERQQIVQDLTRTILRLSRRHIGVLLVFEQKTGLEDIAATGTRLDAILSGALVENIFEPKTPLHDGAVVVRGATIIAAACLLPLSDDPKVARELGTRHRAAIGCSAASDCIVLVVSEETGAISVAREGKLIRYLDEKALNDLLKGLLTDNLTVMPWNRPRRKESASHAE
ncbi:MAG: diadenylate cyclase CdaA [Clostridia bacterium]|jgi:diadenylate cyclase|nr:diadenylate cyclase CdaA [Clostridia bacterium]